jgi:uncharacterized protein
MQFVEFTGSGPVRRWRPCRSLLARSNCRTAAADARLSPFGEPETASPEKPTILRRDGVRIERIDRIGLELGTQWKTQYHVEENDPLSAVAELSHSQTLARNEWQIRVETQMRLSSTGNAFLLQGSLRAFEGANEVCRRDWDRSIPRDFL